MSIANLNKTNTILNKQTQKGTFEQTVFKKYSSNVWVVKWIRSEEVVISSSCVCVSLSAFAVGTVMWFWLRPNILIVITLLSLTLTIPCLQGGSSTSNSDDLKEEKQR